MKIRESQAFKWLNELTFVCVWWGLLGVVVLPYLMDLPSWGPIAAFAVWLFGMFAPVAFYWRIVNRAIEDKDVGDHTFHQSDNEATPTTGGS